MEFFNLKCFIYMYILTKVKYIISKYINLFRYVWVVSFDQFLLFDITNFQKEQLCLVSKNESFHKKKCEITKNSMVTLKYFFFNVCFKWPCTFQRAANCTLLSQSDGGEKLRCLGIVHYLVHLQMRPCVQINSGLQAHKIGLRMKHDLITPHPQHTQLYTRLSALLYSSRQLKGASM